jgi:hypothetical protein
MSSQTSTTISNPTLSTLSTTPAIALTPASTPSEQNASPVTFPCELLLAQKSTHLAILESVLGVRAGTDALEEVLLTPTFEYMEFDDKSSSESQSSSSSESESEDEDEDVFAVRIDDRRRS